DIFLFAHANHQQAYILFNIFRASCNNSGQLFSSHKSKLFFSRNTPVQIQNDIVAQINIPIVEDLGKYLGLPILTSRKLNSSFSPLLERINSKVRLWQPKLLSMAGRLTLIKSVLSPILNYHMQTTLLPTAVIQRLEQALKGFLWGDTENQRHIHLLSWEKGKTTPKCQRFLHPINNGTSIALVLICLCLSLNKYRQLPSNFNVTQDKLIWSSHVETTIHLLRDCSFPRDLWLIFSSYHPTPNFFDTPIHQWCKTNIQTNITVNNISWYILFAFILWSIWLSRNSPRFEEFLDFVFQNCSKEQIFEMDGNRIVGFQIYIGRLFMELVRKVLGFYLRNQQPNYTVIGDLYNSVRFSPQQRNVSLTSDRLSYGNQQKEHGILCDVMHSKKSIENL
ncbi:putative ribonuclease h protein, partial [Quercus suber]